MMGGGTTREQFPDINKLCNFASCWIYVGILLAHHILYISRLRVNFMHNYSSAPINQLLPHVVFLETSLALHSTDQLTAPLTTCRALEEGQLKILRRHGGLDQLKHVPMIQNEIIFYQY